jgi:hypothetical protein
LSDFKYFAKSYQLEGSPIDKLCDRNHQVCLDRNRVDDSRTWLMIKLLFCGDNPHCSTLGLLPLQVSKEKEKERNEKESVQESNSKENGSISEPSAQGGPLIVGNSNNNDDDVQDISGVLEFFEYNESDSESNASETISHSHQELELPKEPFQLRKKISNQGQFLEVPDVDDISTHSGGLSFASSGRRSSMTTQASGSTQKPLPPGLTPVIWDFSGQVIEMLKYYAQKGDVQMSVTVVLVLRDKIVKLIPQLLLLQWFNSYIDLLTRFQLLNEASHIIKLCPLAEVNQISQNSTLYNVGCGQCNRMLPLHSSICQKCEKKMPLNVCAICHQPVKGLYCWCDVCGHGGHLIHFKEWFTKCNWCPAGCGHICSTN